MSIHIYPVQQQITGNFNGGEILENKPIQMSPDATKLQPYSNIFYWAHAWGAVTSTIGLHPHQAFEIVSFVLEGTIEHYDTKNKTWLPLHAGDVQIIRAGNGISHAEKIQQGAHIFQIWFDPNIDKSLLLPATYSDYAAASFPIIQQEGMQVKILKGENAPIEMMTPGIAIKQFDIAIGAHEIQLDDEHIHSFYLIAGSIEITKGIINKDDFFTVDEGGTLTFTAKQQSKLFLISALKEIDYATYASTR